MHQNFKVIVHKKCASGYFPIFTEKNCSTHENLHDSKEAMSKLITLIKYYNHFTILLNIIFFYHKLDLVMSTF